MSEVDDIEKDWVYKSLIAENNNTKEANGTFRLSNRGTVISIILTSNQL
jgi:hypothetical protein